MTQIWSLLEQKIIDRNERGSTSLICEGDLEASSHRLLESDNVVILTGFPCLLDYEIPTETDGPIGALSIGKSLIKMGKSKVWILSDESNHQVLSNSTRRRENEEEDTMEWMDQIEILTFSPPSIAIDSSEEEEEDVMGRRRREWFEENEELKQISSRMDCLIAIERF